MIAIGLAVGRAAIGAGFWLAPRASARALGLGEIDDRAVAIGRIAGTRDLVLAAWHLSALDDRDDLRRASVAVAAADAGDSVAFALLARAGGELVRPGLVGLAAAVPATIAGSWLVRALR
jgi:hypothetical protein